LKLSPKERHVGEYACKIYLIDEENQASQYSFTVTVLKQLIINVTQEGNKTNLGSKNVT